MTMSPGWSVGHKNAWTHLRNRAPVIAPSATIGAVMLLCRRPATKVVVCQCPCAGQSCRPAPRGWAACHLRRAACTEGFFKRQVPFVELTPQGGYLGRNSVCC